MFIEGIIKDKKYKCMFTNEQTLINQYLDIRKIVYTETFNIKDFSTHNDNYDHHNSTSILIVAVENKIVGGARLTTHFKNQSLILPLEHGEFLLDKVFPNMNLQNRIYSEITRMAILSEYRKDRNMASDMFKLLFAKAVNDEAEYMFSVTPKLQCRNNRMHFGKIGYNMKTANDVIVPDTPAYDGKKMFLSTTNIYQKLPLGHETIKETVEEVSETLV